MGFIPKLDDAPWPGFPSDMMSSMIVAATQCEGTVLFFEKIRQSSTPIAFSFEILLKVALPWRVFSK